MSVVSRTARQLSNTIVPAGDRKISSKPNSPRAWQMNPNELLRWQALVLLSWLHEIALKVRATPVASQQLATALGWDASTISAVIHYLKSESLIEASPDGDVNISKHGSEIIETVFNRPDESSRYFPARSALVILNGSFTVHGSIVGRDYTTTNIAARDVIGRDRTEIIGGAAPQESAISPPAHEVVNLQEYADYLIRAYEDWLAKYTPLLAEQRELPTYVVSQGQAATGQQGVTVLNLPQMAGISVLLGESGSGKTTSLWRIAVENAQALRRNDPGLVPVLLSLRSWSRELRCRDLLQQEFAATSASHLAVESLLTDGRMLILIDGLNEVPLEDNARVYAYRDMQQFLVSYARNRFVICCRSSDYEERLLDLEQLKSKLQPHRIFEIRRLDREQIADYVQRYFQSQPEMAVQLLSRLDLGNDYLWRETNSILHLARIPLYLQLILLEFEHSKTLPESMALLLQSFVNHVLQREAVRHASRVDALSKERLLGALAFQGVRQGYLLRIPDRVAQAIMQSGMQILRSDRVLAAGLTLAVVRGELLSNNFIRAEGRQWLEWVHQLIHDYFLASEIVRIRIRADKGEHRALNALLRTYSAGQACIVAVSLMDPKQGARFLVDLIEIDVKVVLRVFEGQNEDARTELAEAIVDLVAEDIGGRRLEQVALALPCLPVVESLFVCFKRNRSPVKIQVCRAISSLVIEYLPLVSIGPQPGAGYYTATAKERSLDISITEPTVKRAIQILRAMIGNSNGWVRFYAAKGLWETEKSQSAQTLVQLVEEGDPAISQQVKRLMAEWGIE
ncbi:MAG: NACHT domain-containing protein [Anaerolineales bacterium]|nr:NACHT domain-containing protein [Anaerolineales bacterium]